MTAGQLMRRAGWQRRVRGAAGPWCGGRAGSGASVVRRVRGAAGRERARAPWRSARARAWYATAAR